MIVDMPPQTPIQQNNSSYDFFMKTEKPKRSIEPTSTKGRIIVVVSGVVALIVIALIASAALSGGGSTDSDLKVAQDQTELVRLSTAASTSATSTATKQFALTTQLSISSAKTDLLALLASNGIKYGTKQLSLTASTTTDIQLSTAAAASLFDQTYQSVMKTQLQRYSVDIKAAFPGAGPKLRSLLNSDSKQAQLLLTQTTQ
jgi:hypothetical protein